MARWEPDSFERMDQWKAWLEHAVEDEVYDIEEVAPGDIDAAVRTVIERDGLPEEL